MDWSAKTLVETKRDAYAAAVRTRGAHDSGVHLTTGSDVTNPWVIPGESLHQEFELLREVGLTPNEILKMTGET